MRPAFLICFIVLVSLPACGSQGPNGVWLKPCCLRRHYIACVCDIDELVHSHGIKSQGHLHFATVHTALELLEAAYAAYEVYTLVRTQVGDTQDITRG